MTPRTLLLKALAPWLLAAACSGSAWALTPEQAGQIAGGDSDERISALNERVAAGDAALVPFVQALLDDAVKTAVGKAYIVQADGSAVEAASGQAAKLPDDAEDVVNNNRMRRELEAAQAALGLFSPDNAVRAKAVDGLRDAADEAKLPLIERALAAEHDETLKARLSLLRAKVLIAAPDADKRIAAAKALAENPDPATRSLLLEQQAAETDPAVKAALGLALDKVQAGLAWGERLGVLFTGISLGSILLLAAVPAAFMASALVGAALERSVIRWLYGRPLETLLATWGISLVLMQAVRSLFGAQNVAVENPAWMSGGLLAFSNLTLPYNRLCILLFAFLVLGSVALLIARTRLGLFVRGVTQNRRMAACMGVNTARIDTYAFSLGAGIAGLAGCALSQVGNVGPDLGQNYIVDAFMVVVTGGVGQLAGTVYAGLGLGIINKLLEGWSGAVLAKIMVLVLIVGFIQKRPQGLFAMKGRSAEA
jgi:urea transport system permease protein